MLFISVFTLIQALRPCFYIVQDRVIFGGKSQSQYNLFYGHEDGNIAQLPGTSGSEGRIYSCASCNLSHISVPEWDSDNISVFLALYWLC